MTNTSQESPSAPLYEFYSRSVGFIAGAITIILGTKLGVWSGFEAEVLSICVFYPIIALLISKRLPENITHLRRPIFITLDATFVGCLLAYMNFAIVPSILFLVMVNASVMSLGSATTWFTCIVGATLGVFVGTLIFGFQPHFEAPNLLNISSALGMSFHLAVTSFYSGKQTKQLEKLHSELKAEQAKQKNLSNKVAKYISPQIWESIFSGSREVKLETQRKKLVVFFSDIRGFTALSEQLESEALTELLNNYLTEMTNIALKYGGTIDKYIGDSIMVFFGDPTTQGAKKDTLACVAMAIEMRKHMKVLRQKWRAQGVQTPLEIRMGINTGYCTVGNFGTESRMDYTIIGREVNMASRLESAAEAGEILLSHEAYALIQDKIICREKGTITAKGFSRPVPVYEAVDFRHNLAAKSSFIEHELPGFSMYMDTNRINNYDREKIAKALELAAIKMKNQNKMQG
ncbi:adenylate/guanylate cyclase domain-containing protein [Bermanella sp. WJH001]|uniref:adenylate/guanylate cyclase domain-containing protein n=1 Tax=Bermanella sp. WJH001 TaxID=3048005 RepID=UPI0024BDC480|nr:adenylate/guanylate cyclase domain-containing protein [Bermanella sp. WJH001]MDJ1536924.1 adenylate/guanylate cyclase domain-containing protein [Bermanella sp. WJH001]